MINKVLAASITVAFLAAVRPDPVPSAVGYAITAVIIYEGLYYCIKYIRETNKKKHDDHYITLKKFQMKRNARVRKEEGAKLDDLWIYWPLREVEW